MRPGPYSEFLLSFTVLGQVAYSRLGISEEKQT